MPSTPWKIISLTAMEGAPHGTVVTAETQTAGRGRRGSAWLSPPGRNILCSLLLRPDWPLEHWPRLTHAIALAICETLEAHQLQPQIKWPNDIYLEGKKLCGILLETAASPQGMFVVIGFGVNVNLEAAEFPPDLSTIATSLRIQTERTWDREMLLGAILQRFAGRAEQASQDFPALLRAIAPRSMLIGQEVSLISHGIERRGRVLGLSAQGGLRFLATNVPDHAAAIEEDIISADLVRPISSNQS
jgi:BirA family transcriptional regulator, biotin operon repressor / biotin---[acetyl-CoA-carboxylase] ligase